MTPGLLPQSNMTPDMEYLATEVLNKRAMHMVSWSLALGSERWLSENEGDGSWIWRGGMTGSSSPTPVPYLVQRGEEMVDGVEEARRRSLGEWSRERGSENVVSENVARRMLSRRQIDLRECFESLFPYMCEYWFVHAKCKVLVFVDLRSCIKIRVWLSR